MSTQSNNVVSNTLGITEILQQPDGTLLKFKDGSTTMLFFNSKQQTLADKSADLINRMHSQEVANAINDYFKNATTKDLVAFNAAHMHDAQLPEKTELNPGHYSEFADRAYVINCNIDKHLTEHPVAEHQPEIKKKLLQATLLIGEVYQLAAQLDRNEN
jgi:hypothetical protein